MAPLRWKSWEIRLVKRTAATDALAGIISTDSREQSGIWSTASGVLAAYQSDSVIATTELPALDAGEFCQGRNTMYICSPGRRQHLFAPLIVAAIGDVRDATYECARQGTSVAPTLFALDEVANIAPLPDLAKLVSEGAGQGLIVMACLQDLSQARSRWGDASPGFPLHLWRHRGVARYRRSGNTAHPQRTRWRYGGRHHHHQSLRRCARSYSTFQLGEHGQGPAPPSRRHRSR